MAGPGKDELTALARAVAEAAGGRARRRVGSVDYSVEEITWPVSRGSDGSSPFACPHTAFVLIRENAVIDDVRHEYGDGFATYGVVGDRLGRWMRFRIGSPGERGWDLHLATEEELAAFAAEAPDVAAAFGLDA